METIDPHKLNNVIHVTKPIGSSHNGNANETKKPKPRPSESIDIDYLFKRFSVIWGNAWDKDFTANPGLIAEEWADALQGLNKFAIEKGIKKSREAFPTWPPKIGEFLKLCQGFDVAPSMKITIQNAADIANKRLQRLYEMGNAQKINGKIMFFLIRDVYDELFKKIHHLQNEFCDFALCAEEGCYRFEVFEAARLSPWRCAEHAEMANGKK